jgi:hypothetical protein
MAIFWFVVGVVMQIYWPVLQPRMMIPVDRTVMGCICFIMFSYCFIRFRLGRMRDRWHEESDEPPPPRPRPMEPVDPSLDFSDSNAKNDAKKDSPAS